MVNNENPVLKNIIIFSFLYILAFLIITTPVVLYASYRYPDLSFPSASDITPSQQPVFLLSSIKTFCEFFILGSISEFIRLKFVCKRKFKHNKVFESALFGTAGVFVYTVISVVQKVLTGVN